MADHYDEKTRNAASEISDDDPLAELARIIGYDRPGEAKNTAADVSDPDDADIAIDLEAELLSELKADQPEPDGSGESLASVAAEKVEDALEIAEADEFVVAEDWLTERPADDVQSDNEVAASPVASADTIVNFRSNNSNLPDVPDYLDEADFLGVPKPADEVALPDLPDEALFEALEQELSISADELLVDEDKSNADEIDTDWDKAQSDWDDAAWDKIVGEKAGEDEVGTAINEAAGDIETVAEPVEYRTPEQIRDDDILADMARFDIPLRDETAATNAVEELKAAFSTRPQAADDADLIDEPDLSAFEFDEIEKAPTEASFETNADQPWDEVSPFEDDEAPEEVQSTGDSQPLEVVQPFEEVDSIEEELTAGLDNFVTQVDGDDNAENAGSVEFTEPQVGSIDPLDEIETDFDDAAASFLADEEFELDLADEAAPEAEDFVAEVHVEPAGDDEIASAFSDLMPEKAAAEPTTDEASEVAEENLTWPEYPPDQADTNSKGLFGAAAALAAGVGLITSKKPAQAEGHSDWDGKIDPISEPPFDETEWLDALGIDGDDNQAQESRLAERELDSEQSDNVQDDVLPFPAAGAGYVDTRAYDGVPEGVEDQTNDMGSDVFDESAINDTSNSPYFVGEIDVPDLPVDEPRIDAGINDYFDDDLDREFASLVDAEGAAGSRADRPQGGPNGWQHGTAAITPDANADYSDLENDLGLTGGNEIEGPYRPHPVPVDADAALREPARRTDGSGQSKQGPVIAAVVLGLAVLFGGAVFGWSWLSGGSSNSDGPKIIMADKEPVKVLPENPGGTNVLNQDKAVYDKVDGNQNSSADQRNLNDSAEEPVDVVQKTIDPELLPLEGREGEASDKGEARLTADDTDSGVTDPGQTNPVISPRKVRTMVVRPDGTIVPREEPEEAVSAEPVTQPETVTPVAAAPVAEPVAATEQAKVADTQASELASSTEVETAAANQAAEASEQPAGTETATGNDALAPVRVVKTVTISKAPVPQTRPSEQPVNVVGQVSETGRVSGTPVEQEPTVAPQVAAAQAEPAAAAPANVGGYYVQIASQPTDEAAKASYANLSNRFSSVIGGRGVDIQRADIPGKGVYHRVRIPAGSKSEAGNLCARYKSAGGNCFVTR